MGVKAMSADNLWDDDENDEPEEQNPMKQLRAALKAAQKKNAEFEAELKQLRPTVRQAQVSSVLKNVGVDAKYAKLVPSDLEPTEEALRAWAEEFGFVSQASATDNASAASDASSNAAAEEDPALAAQMAQWGRIQSQSSAAGATTPDQESQQIAMLLAAKEASKGNADVFMDMLKGKVPIT
jgi:hypothetical protein